MFVSSKEEDRPHTPHHHEFALKFIKSWTQTSFILICRGYMHVLQHKSLALAF